MWGKEVKLSDLLAGAGMTDEAKLIKFTAVDGYTVTLTVKELFKDKRYPAGAMVTLRNAHNDNDKIYYTIDGNDPNLNSPMYNWIARRRWPARADVLGAINHPVGPIDKDTTIKAITIGLGKLDSDIVTFQYRYPWGERNCPDRRLPGCPGQQRAAGHGLPSGHTPARPYPRPPPLRQ